MIPVLSARQASTTTIQTDMSAPAALGAITLKTGALPAQMFAKNVGPGRGLTWAVRPVKSVLQTQTHRRPQRCRLIVDVILDQQALTEKRVLYVWQGSIRLLQALQIAATVH